MNMPALPPAVKNKWPQTQDEMQAILALPRFPSLRERRDASEPSTEQKLRKFWLDCKYC